MSDPDRHRDGSAPDAPAPDGAPRAVAGFHLLRKIAEGGMSAVYQSFDVVAARPVAVKLLAEHLSLQPEFVGRFYREARLGQVLEHPCVVRGYASGYDHEAGKHYLVMEYIDGVSLDELVARSGPLPIAEAMSMPILTTTPTGSGPLRARTPCAVGPSMYSIAM